MARGSITQRRIELGSPAFNSVTPRPPARTRLIGLAWLVVIGIVTLTPAPEQASRIAETSWRCLICGDAGSTDVLLNLLLFLPLGLVAHALRWSFARAFLGAALLTISIELLQATLIVGRDASLSDVLANSLGAGTGWLLSPTLRDALHPTRRFALRAASVLLLVSGAIWLVSGWGVAVALHRQEPWTGQPLHLWAGHDPFPGTMQFASLGSVMIPNDPLERLPAARDTVDLIVDVTRRDTVIARRRTSIIRVVDPTQRVQVALGSQGRDLVFEHRVTASGWRLRTPAWRFSDAAVIAADTPWRWEVVRTPGQIELRSGAVGAAATVTTLPISIGLGWSLIHPFAPAIDQHAFWWSVLWIGWWMGWLGWFAGRLGWRTALGFGTAALLSMVAAATLSGLPDRVNELVVAALVFGLFALGAEKKSREHAAR